MFALLDRFVELGGNFIDTARMYSDWIPGEKNRSSAAEIRADLEGSLRTLRVETIDLYWLHRDDPARPVEHFVDLLNTFNQALARLVGEIARARGVTPNGVVLGYLWTRAFPVVPIVGASSPGQLDDNFAAIGFRLSADEMRALEAASNSGLEEMPASVGPGRCAAAGWTRDDDDSRREFFGPAEAGPTSAAPLFRSA